jgi:hypothetical protein
MRDSRLAVARTLAAWHPASGMDGATEIFSSKSKIVRRVLRQAAARLACIPSSVDDDC